MSGIENCKNGAIEQILKQEENFYAQHVEILPLKYTSIQVALINSLNVNTFYSFLLKVY